MVSAWHHMGTLPDRHERCIKFQPPPIQMSLFPVWPSLCELSLMCQICQIFSTMLKEAFVMVEEPRPAHHLWRRWPAEWTDCQIQLFCVSVLSHGSIVEAGQADPTSRIQPSSLPCMHVSHPLFPARDFIAPLPPLFKSDALNATLIKEK